MSNDENNLDEHVAPSLIVGKDLERYFKLEDALFEFARLFRDEDNDRAMVIVGAAFLDTQLEHILRNFHIDDEKEVDLLLKPEQPFGTYGARVRATYCMGLIGKTIRDDLRLIGRIRNAFAHNLYASFEDDKIKAWSISLQWHRVSYMQPPSDAAPREIFNVGVNRLVSYLSGVVSIARNDKRAIHRLA